MCTDAQLRGKRGVTGSSSQNFASHAVIDYTVYKPVKLREVFPFFFSAGKIEKNNLVDIQVQK